MKLIISGHSDDIITIQGDITEEFYPPDGEAFFIAVSDGTLLRISYDGMWNIRVLVTGLGAVIDHQPATDEDTNYSDVVTITNELKVKWIVGGTGLLP
jgi:hypothetical protein